MATPIGTKFGIRLRVHLGMDIGENVVFQTAGPIGTKFGTCLWIHLEMDIG